MQPKLSFGVEPIPPDAPLAARMRPQTLDEFIGQEEAVGPGSMLRGSLERGRLPSFILWGPPGCGKTTLARIVARGVEAEFVSVSAVSSGVADLRRVVAEAQARRASGRRTVLFIDEIHRFNRAQQDVILPYVEDGTVTLIGATTENPSFEVIAPLLSRARVVRLKQLGPAELSGLVDRALADRERGLGMRELAIDEGGRLALAEGANGDGRAALTALEIAADVAEAGGRPTITAQDVAQALQDRRPYYDRQSDYHYDTISAFIKTIRGSDPNAALYWLARMTEAGEDPLFIVRRMVILASEDVGLADPQALVVATACQQAVHFIGMPEGFYAMAECALYLALAPKSNSAGSGYGRAMADAARTAHLPVPMQLRNAVTGLMRQFGYGQGYRSAHEERGHVAREMRYLPEELGSPQYYVPGELGFEARAVARWSELRAGEPTTLPEREAK
ncbi:replication-associated recombination protein A [Candidatus Amarobacter glycogenicus]|uniref:replication-associated recombination protein A n=1 Tax=Candidatus Amarobacter glycogenicus TaxID=3140699 RepID=UPI002A15B73D|nr:replication-associated recombination protein A [Dehalococcoidia bacterium]